jgi:hypothetical protein
VLDHLKRRPGLRVPRQLGHRVGDRLPDRIGAPQPGAAQTREQRRNRPVVDAWIADQPLPAAVDGDIDQPLVEQRAIELGEEDARVLHLDKILHRDGGGKPEPDQPRREPGERRATLGGRPRAEAGVEDDQLQIGRQP